MRILVGLLTAAVGACQVVTAPFVNLDFEANRGYLGDLDYRAGQSSLGPIYKVIPGWQMEYRGSVYTTLYINGCMCDVNQAALYDFASDGTRFGMPEWRFALWLAPGDVDHPYVLSQRGDIPADARSLRFLNYGNPFDVHIDGVSLAVSYEGPQARADVSVWSGRTVDLAFRTVYRPNWEPPGYSYNTLDSIRFSTQVVPEASPVLLLGAGVGILWLTRRSRRRGLTFQSGGLAVGTGEASA